jgi:hypothetical protein
VRTHPRLSPWPASFVGAAILTLGLIGPISASARPYRPHSAMATMASRAEDRTSGAEERAARTRERRAARAEERATRAQERAARRAARLGSARERRGESGASPAEFGASPPQSESGADSPDAAAGRCHVSVEASSKRITAGETVTVLGKLTCPTGVSAANQQVAVYENQRGPGAPPSGVAGTAITQADGSYSVKPAAFDTNTIFRVHEGSHRAHTVVKVAPALTLSGVAPVVGRSDTGGHSSSRQRTVARFTGSLTPASTGALVALQVSFEAAGERWHTVAFGHVGTDGTYSITHAFRISGMLTTRTVAHAGRYNTVAVSNPVSYAASQPQNPRLTIQTSADPITYGQSMILSGTAAGATSQPVTLLTRTNGSAWTIAATATTGVGGDYTFTQTPLQNTSYRVTSGTTSSTILFAAVKSTIVTNASPDSVQSGEQLTFSGTVTPARVGEVVYLESGYASGLGYHVVGTGTVNGSLGYTIAHTFNGAGMNILRIKVPGDDEQQSSTSEPITITVTR